MKAYNTLINQKKNNNKWLKHNKDKNKYCKDCNLNN